MLNRNYRVRSKRFLVRKLSQTVPSNFKHLQGALVAPRDMNATHVPLLALMSVAALSLKRQCPDVRIASRILGRVEPALSYGELAPIVGPREEMAVGVRGHRD